MEDRKELRIQMVMSEYKEGNSEKEIAEKHGIALHTVKMYIRDAEHRMTNEEKSAMQEIRKARIKADLSAGMTMHEAAEKEGLDYDTVTSYIRGDRETIRIAQYKKELLEWAKKKSGSTIKTPEGKMTLLRVYPHIVECAKQCAKGYIITTFTLAEVYYINQGG